MSNETATILLSQVAPNGGFRIIADDTAPSSRFSVRPAGDLNGDGLMDLAFSAAVDTPDSDKGVTYILFGADGGLPATINVLDIGAGQAGVVLRGAREGDRSWLATGIGDINADGTDDLAIAINTDIFNAPRSAGAFAVVYGSSAGFDTSVDLAEVEEGGLPGAFLTGVEPKAASSLDIAPIGDVNGDGIDDLFVIDPIDDFLTVFPGIAYIVFGRVGGLDSTINLPDIGATGQGVVLRGGTEDEVDNFFEQTRGLGDVNGDGFRDVFIRSFSTSYVVFGGPNLVAGNLDLAALPVARGFTRADLFDGVGDVNGDGLGDLAINFTQAGLLFGRADGLAEAPADVTFRRPDGQFIRSITAAGDFDGDGIGDILLSVFLPDGALPGSVRDAELTGYVILGRRAGLSGEIDLAEVGEAVAGFVIRNDLPDGLGRTYAALGDVNNDGYDDVGVTVPEVEGSENAVVGGAYIVYGRPAAPAPQRGTSAADTLRGTAADDALTGLGGADLLRGLAGRDTLRGGDGADSLDGGAGDDQLRLGAGDTATGGAGRDGFLLLADAPGARIVLTDFARTERDSLNLSRIDADTTQAGDQDFTWIGRARFGGTAGELRWERPAGANGRDSLLLGDTDGDRVADVAVLLAGVDGVRESWFVL